MQRVRIVFSIIILICFSFYLKAALPSKYIGIFNYYNGIENGKLIPSSSKYSGEWKHNNVKGKYNEGIPCGSWFVFFPYGSPKIIYYYNGKNYISMSYYPDGIMQCQSYGNVKISKNSFKHETKDSIIWGPLGSRVKNKRFSFINNQWNWSVQNQTVFEKEKDFIDNEVYIKIVSFILNNDVLRVALYVYSEESFIYKITYTYNLDHEKGILVFGECESIGEHQDFKVNIKFDENSTSSDTKELLMNVKFSLNNKTTKISFPYIL